MTTHTNTVLITGGSNGIGLALAKRYMESGDTVIICGRREGKLQEAQAKLPGLHVRVCDVADDAQRVELYEWVTKEFSDLNVLVNNAGIQQRVNLLKAVEPWEYYQNEIRINLDAPVHLSTLFLSHLCGQQRGAIVNVSSGLAIAPATWAPIYSATKAALHSFSMSLRLQLESTNVAVIEILPPAVNTDLGGVGLHTFGADLDEFADSVYAAILRGELEIGYGGTEQRLLATKPEVDEMTRRMWEGFLKNNPKFQA